MIGRRADDPLLQTFEEVARHRPAGLLSPFVAHDRTDGLAAGDGDPVRLGSGPEAPFCAVLVDVGAAGAGSEVRCGLAGPGGVLAVHRADEATVSVEVAGSEGTVVAGSAPVSLVAPFRLACVVNENRVTVLAADGSGEEWRPLLTLRDEVSAATDLRDPAVLGGLQYACGTRAGASLTRVRAGYSGAAGLRDPQVVRHPDGRPVVRDGRLYLTATNAGLGFFQQAHWGVWTLDLTDPTRLTQVGALFSRRDGLLLGDHAGAVVLDEANDRWIVLVSSWGDHTPERGVHVRHVTVSGTDLLQGVHVLPTERLALPTEASAWDPSLARVDGRWYLAFVECPSFGPPRYVFHPALARTDDDDPTRGLGLVGADGSLEQTEGTILQRLGDDWYVLASDRDAAEYPVYDLRMTRVGALRAPYGTNIPHPMVVRAGDGPWWMVTFDGTAWHEEALGYGTHGDLIVLAGRPPSARETLEQAARSGAAHLPEGVRRGLRGALGAGRDAVRRARERR
ncbi:hypothetical protein DQ237_07505 [Blastococcus sp. TF02-8]|uniref:hypothetical protein n=1 Tax=Blastococcus sp. TF02-8 TaxID=2250574 RepID=UPI000DE91DF9|nr:hypothetical protein [Blastococcus sp. TF02-8]RBY96485.1 hypothetical protein DQ237_07505 [Blastococcus sp. TF02-8]